MMVCFLCVICVRLHSSPSASSSSVNLIPGSTGSHNRWQIMLWISVFKPWSSSSLPVQLLMDWTHLIPIRHLENRQSSVDQIWETYINLVQVGPGLISLKNLVLKLDCFLPKSNLAFLIMLPVSDNDMLTSSSELIMLFHPDDGLLHFTESFSKWLPNA